MAKCLNRKGAYAYNAHRFTSKPNGQVFQSLEGRMSFTTKTSNRQPLDKGFKPQEEVAHCAENCLCDIVSGLLNKPE